jgi:hypothetical protein
MADHELVAIGSCWVCDAQMRRASLARPGRRIARHGSPVGQDAVLHEFVCTSCGGTDCVQLAAPARELASHR